jgi:hypothetical protein
MISPTSLENANLDTPTTTTIAATTSTQNIAANDSDSSATSTSVAGGTGAVQEFYAVPSQFGTLSAVQYAVGAFSSGTQTNINIETPSLNSFVYDYQTDCDA